MSTMPALRRYRQAVAMLAPVRSWTDLYTRCGWLLFLGLAIVDLLTMAVPAAGGAGVVLWYLSYVYVFGFGTYCAIDLIKQATGRKALVTLLMLLIFIFTLVIHLQDARSLSGENTQEITCTVRQLSIAMDHGYRQPCFLGYPTRQYYLPAVPTLLFGRSLWALNGGGTLYCLLGLVIFASGVIKYFNQTITGDLVNGILLGSIFHFYYFNYLMFVYEQSIFPFSLALAVVGLFLHYIATRKGYLLILSGFILLYLVYSYTPGLALVGLGVVVLAYTAVREVNLVRGKLPRIALIILLLWFFLTSLMFRSDVRIFDTQGETLSQKMGILGTALEHILFQNHGVPMVSPLYNSLFVLFTLASLFLLFGRIPAVIAVWMIVTIAFTVVSQGFTYYPVDFRLERATVIVPVYLGLLAAVCRRWRLQGKSAYLFALALVIGSTGLYFQALYLQARGPNRHWPFIQWLQHNVPLAHYDAQHPRNLYFVLGADQYNNLISLNDDLQYFAPQVQIQPDIQSEGEVRSVTGILVIPRSDSGAAVVTTLAGQHRSYRYDGQFISDAGVGLAVFETR